MKSFLKKILALAIILWMFSQTNVTTFAELSNDDLNNVVVATPASEYKAEVLKYKWWEKLIKKIDIFIEKASEKKLDIISKKIDKIFATKKLSKKNTAILKYINEQIKFKKLLENMLSEAESEVDSLIEKDIFKNTLSASDTKKVNEQLVKIQNNLLNRWIESYENILWKLEKYSNYEEKWNFEAKLNVDHEMFWKSNAVLKIKDYVASNSGFDSQFKTKIEAVIDAMPKGQEEMKMEFSGLVDYIIKDQNYYILLKDLKIVDDKDILKLDSKIEKIKEIASKNKYIHFEDKNAAAYINTLKELNPANILKQGKQIASKPLFTAYKKDWNKFYLIPSKYGCDTAKTLAQKFDPFNWNTCTDSQYQDLLDSIADSKIEFFIDFSGKNTNIGFESKQDWMEKLEWNIVFSDKYIEEINFIFTPDQKMYPNEWASFNFKKAKFLNAKIYANSGDVNLNLTSTLDAANRFKSIDFKYNDADNFNSELTLKNRKITGKFSWTWYKSKFSGTISGKTDTSNKLSTLNIINKYINSSSYNPGETNTVFTYNYWKYSLDNKYSSEWFKSNLLASFNITNNRLSELNFNLEMLEKDSTFDYDNYKTVYSWDFKKIVDSKIEYKNKIINWKTTISVDGKEYLVITNTWRAEEDKFELNTNIDLKNEAVNNFNKWFNSVWNNNIKTKKVEWNFNIKTDTTSNNNNFNIYWDVELDDKKIIEIELDNKSRKTYKKVKILAPMPNDTIEAEEAFSNPELY